MVKESETSDESNTLPLEEDYQKQWGKKEATSFKDLVLRALQKCVEEGSKEMVEGGTITEVINGEYVITTIPNQPKTFFSSIEAFKTLIFSEASKDEKKKIEDIEESIKGFWDFYFKEYLEEETEPLFKQEAKRTKRIPEKSDLRRVVFKTIDDQTLISKRLILQELILLYRRIEKKLSGKISARI